jgi:hypothetical protein
MYATSLTHRDDWLGGHVDPGDVPFVTDAAS